MTRLTKQPPYLSGGETIGIVCPAGFMPPERMAECIRVLTEEWGYAVKLGSTTKSNSTNYFSGSDQERLDDLQRMIDDDDVRAILCARGGYGMTRIIDRLRLKRFAKKPKWVIGYSDITILLSHLYTNYRVASLHAPMAGAFGNDDHQGIYLRSLKDALEGKPGVYFSDAHPLNKPGTASGVLVGGNLALMAHTIGTSSEIKTRNRILFIEDVGEYLYNIDRMLHQLKRSGKLSGLAGLIFGGFTDLKDTERPFGQTIDDILQGVITGADYPVCFDFPVSHGIRNVALKVGARYKLIVGDSGCELIEK